MICIISGNYEEAKTYARGQNWLDGEWFFPIDLNDLKWRSNFHVIVIGSAGYNVPNGYFNSLYELAQQRGRMNRG